MKSSETATMIIMRLARDDDDDDDDWNDFLSLQLVICTLNNIMPVTLIKVRPPELQYVLGRQGRTANQEAWRL